MLCLCVNRGDGSDEEATVIDNSSAVVLLDDSITYLTHREAAEIDEVLMGPLGFSVDQLMELAGLSVAAAIAEVYRPDTAANNDLKMEKPAAGEEEGRRGKHANLLPFYQQVGQGGISQQQPALEGFPSPIVMVSCKVFNKKHCRLENGLENR